MSLIVRENKMIRYSTIRNLLTSDDDTSWRRPPARPRSKCDSTNSETTPVEPRETSGGGLFAVDIVMHACALAR